jgi:phosphoglycolate phosphatase
MKKIAMFDFDGVLVDTLGICHSINKEIHSNLSIEEYKSFFLGNIYNAKRIDGTEKKHHPNFRILYDEKVRELIVPPVLIELIKNLSEKYILVIISSSYTDSIRKILDRFNIADYFSEILGADVDRDKVVKINNVLKKYKTQSKDTIFITDTVGDVKEGEKCNVRSIAVTWGFHDFKTLASANPVKIVSDPLKLLFEIENVLD